MLLVSWGMQQFAIWGTSVCSVLLQLHVSVAALEGSLAIPWRWNVCSKSYPRDDWILTLRGQFFHRCSCVHNVDPTWRLLGNVNLPSLFTQEGYSILAARCHRKKMNLFYIRPKLHMLAHEGCLVHVRFALMTHGYLYVSMWLCKYYKVGVFWNSSHRLRLRIGRNAERGLQQINPLSHLSEIFLSGHNAFKWCANHLGIHLGRNFCPTLIFARFLNSCPFPRLMPEMVRFIFFLPGVLNISKKTTAYIPIMMYIILLNALMMHIDFPSFFLLLGPQSRLGCCHRLTIQHV